MPYRILVIACAIVLSIQLSFAQGSCRAYRGSTKIGGGLEIDALPWLTGGYAGGVWISKDIFRLRYAHALVNIPQSSTPSGFKDYQLVADAYLIDVFPVAETKMEGWWFALGFEEWKSYAKNSINGASHKWTTMVGTFGGGYLWYPIRSVPGFYVNPWGAIHLPSYPDNHPTIGGKEWNPQRVVGEVSLKAGYRIK